MTLEEFYYTEKVLLDQFYAKYKNGRLPAGILKSETIKQIIQRLKDYDTQSKATFWCDLNSDYFWTTEPRVTRIIMDYIADQITYRACCAQWQKQHDL